MFDVASTDRTGRFLPAQLPRNSRTLTPFTVATLLAALALAPMAMSRPLFLEPTATLSSPALAWPELEGPIATNGEDIFVYSDRSDHDERREAALHFRRVAGAWQYQGVLHSVIQMQFSDNFSSAFAMQGDLAILNFGGQSHVWRNVGGTWQDTGPSWVGGEDIEIDGEDLVSSTGDCRWDAFAHDANGAGRWTATLLIGQPRGCDDSFAGGEVDRLGNFIVIGTAYTNDLEAQEVPVYERTPAGWVRRGAFVTPASNSEFTGAVGLRNPVTGLEAIVTGVNGAYAYSPFEADPSPHRLQPPDAYAAGRTRGDRSNQLHGVEIAGGLVFIREGAADRGGLNVINVFRGNRIEGYEHVGVLVGPNGVDLGQEFDVAETPTGLVVAATGDGDVHVFHLPADLSTPAPRYLDFEDDSAASWTPLLGQFWVLYGGGNHFYRQWDTTTGDTRALLNDSTWRNQAIEADITPRGFNGNDRWVGLMTRYRDAQNYYYLTLRSSGSVQLRRMAGGQFTELARSPVTVVNGRPYRLRLESVGTVHRVYLNGELVIDVDDATLTTPGQVGLAMYKAAADFDNVVASPAPYYTLFRTDFTNFAGSWRGSGQWERANGVLTQSSVTGNARAITGAPVEDQVVRARIRPIAYRAPEGAQERWSGLIARYTDDDNYYYVTLRSSNQLSLRKLVNGQIVELASAPYTVNLNTSYDVRLEAVGDQLRVTVNGQPRLQAHDTSHTRGSSGLMTWKTAAEFDDYVAYQP